MRKLPIIFAFIFSFSFSAATRAATLSVKITDETGAATAARVYLQDSSGKSFFPPGAIVYNRMNWNVSEKHFVPPAGEFSIELPAGDYSLRIERGKEFLPVADRIVIAQSPVEKSYRLERWVSMASLGWYSADMHAHVPLQDAAALQSAEDLNLLLPITLWRVSFVPPYRDPMLDEFLAKSDASGVIREGPSRFLLPVNEELESDQSALLLDALGRAPVPLEFPFEEMAKTVHARGGFVDSEKATSVELPSLAALGEVDFVGLANNHFWRSDCYTGPWGVWPDHALHEYPRTCEGFARAGFDIYYALLNLGAKVRLSAGSAYGVQPVPLGWSRVYVHVPGELTPQKWFAAARAGRSFVTTGPMLFLRVNQWEPGDEARGLAFPATVNVEVAVLSVDEPQSVELVVNGKVTRLPLARKEGDSRAWVARTQLRLDASSWIAARSMGQHGARFDLAHTAPVYVWNAGQPLPADREGVGYLLARINSLLSEARAGRAADGSDSTSNTFPDEETRARTLQLLEEAKQSLESNPRP